MISMSKELAHDMVAEAELGAQSPSDECLQKAIAENDKDILSDKQLEAIYENDKMLTTLFSMDRQLRLKHRDAKVVLASASAQENELQDPLLEIDMEGDLAKSDYLNYLSDLVLDDASERSALTIALQYDQDLQNAYIKGSDEELSKQYPDYIKARKRLEQARNSNAVWNDIYQTLRQHLKHLHHLEMATWGDLEHFQITIFGHDAWEEQQSKHPIWEAVGEAFEALQDTESKLWKLCINKGRAGTASFGPIIQYQNALFNYKKIFYSEIYLQLPTDPNVSPVNLQYRDELLAQFD